MPIRNSLEPPRFVDDAFEQAADRAVIERAAVDVLHVREHFGLAGGLVDVHARLFLDTADLERARGARAEQAHELLVERIDPAPQRLELAYNLLFSHRTYSEVRSHRSAAPACSATKLTSALP